MCVCRRGWGNRCVSVPLSCYKTSDESTAELCPHTYAGHGSLPQVNATHIFLSMPTKARWLISLLKLSSCLRPPDPEAAAAAAVQVLAVATLRCKRQAGSEAHFELTTQCCSLVDH